MRRLLQWSIEANGLVAAGLVAPFDARSSNLEIGAGLLQATLAAALHILPPLIPPPTWNNETFDLWYGWFCLLAHSASNDICQCFSVSADGQWSQLFWIDVVSSEDMLLIIPATNLLLSHNWNRCGSQQQTVRWQMSRTPCLMDTLQVFTTTYLRKVGRTSDEMYKACFSTYTSSERSTLHKVSVPVHK